MMMTRYLLLICLVFMHLLAHAQQGGPPLPVTIIAAARGIVLADSPTCYLDSVNTTRGGSMQDVASVRNKIFATPWSRYFDQLSNNPRPYVFWLQTELRNDGDSVRDLSLDYSNLDFVDVWLLPANIQSPAASSASAVLPPQYVPAGVLRPSPKADSYVQRQTSTIPLDLPAHTTARLFIRVRQLTDDYSFQGFTIYDDAALSAGYLKDLPQSNAFLVLQMLFQGFLLCQLLYVLVQWFIVRRPEYLYYFLYMLLIAGYFLSKQESLFGIGIIFTRWPSLKIYLGKTLLILPYYVYFRFVRSYLDFPRDYPRLNYLVIRLEYFLLAYAVLDFAYILLTFDRGVQTLVYTIVFSIVFLISMGFTIYLMRYRQPLVYFILAGSIAVGTGHILGLLFSYLEIERHLDLGVSDIFVFPQCGIVLEIFCFTAGLSYKNRKIEQEKIAGQEKLIEQLKANDLLQTRMQHIRNKIAQDLHDDIGSTLSSISILSDLAIRGNSNTQAIETINEIKDSSLMLMERMDDIVWSINPRNDSLENLLMRVRHFATTLFEARGIDYTIDIQKNIHEVQMPMEYRQHIYLILKEAINNLVKYAGATEALIEVRFDQSDLTLCVRDNGCGFQVPAIAGPGADTTPPADSSPGSLPDPVAPPPGTDPKCSNPPGTDPKRGTPADPDPGPGGNGLPGMFHRANLMNARVDITSAPGQGTTIRLRVDLA